MDLIYVMNNQPSQLPMPFVFNDGGRSHYFNGTDGDCVARSIAIAARINYLKVYNNLAQGKQSQRKGKYDTAKTRQKTALHGIDTKRKWLKDYMLSLKFIWVPTMFIGQGCKIHLKAGELPKAGWFVLYRNTTLRLLMVRFMTHITAQGLERDVCKGIGFWMDDLMLNTIDQEMVKKARAFAIDKHGSQMYGDKPYVYHLDAVASILKPYGVLAQILGYLHDVIEDTEVAEDDLNELFGGFVSKAVVAITDQPGSNRKERKQKTYELMAQITGKFEVVLIAKTADRLANVKACQLLGNGKLLKMYQMEHAQFKKAIYRPGLCDELWIQLDQLITSI